MGNAKEIPKISVRIDLEGDMAERLECIRKDLGFSTNKSVLIYLINRAYEKGCPESNPEAKREVVQP